VYAVDIVNSAKKDVRALDGVNRRRVLAAFHALETNPRPHGCKKLVDEDDLWRLRVGDYRVIYAIDDGRKVVTVRAVRHRSHAYD